MTSIRPPVAMKNEVVSPPPALTAIMEATKDHNSVPSNTCGRSQNRITRMVTAKRNARRAGCGRPHSCKNGKGATFMPRNDRKICGS